MITPPKEPVFNTGDAELREQLIELIRERHICNYDPGKFDCKVENFNAYGNIHTRCRLERESFDEIMQLIAAHDQTLIKTILAEDVPEKHGHSTTHNPDYRLEDKYGAPCYCSSDPFNYTVSKITTALQKRLKEL